MKGEMEMRLTKGVLAAALLAYLPSAAAADSARGKLLYETHCLQCHSEGISQREKKIARSYPEIRAEVVRWYRNIRLSWQPGDVEDVARYLNDRFYRYPCTGERC